MPPDENPAPGAPRRLLLAAGALWTSPNTVAGLLLGALGMPLGARAHWRSDDLDTTCCTYAHRAGLCREPQVRLCDHERAHVYQYMALGPLFLPLYLLSGGISVRNRFERAADHYARHGRGWWPWSPTPDR